MINRDIIGVILTLNLILALIFYCFRNEGEY